MWADMIELKIKRSFRPDDPGGRYPGTGPAHPCRAPIRSARHPAPGGEVPLSTDPASTAEAIDMYLTSLRYLAAAGPATLAAQAQAGCLLALEQGDAIGTAARARILAAFTAAQGYSADADYSATSWLIHRTGVTKGAARGHRAWARRAVTHPLVVAALAEGTALTEPMAREICRWTGKLPASPWPSCATWTTGRSCRASGSGRWPSGGPPAAPPPPRPAATARPGWPARPPAPSPATPRSSPWSPARLTPVPWMSW